MDLINCQIFAKKSKYASPDLWSSLKNPKPSLLVFLRNIGSSSFAFDLKFNKVSSLTFSTFSGSENSLINSLSAQYFLLNLYHGD